MLFTPKDIIPFIKFTIKRKALDYMETREREILAYRKVARQGIEMVDKNIVQYNKELDQLTRERADATEDQTEDIDGKIALLYRHIQEAERQRGRYRRIIKLLS